ncbi:MAG TPA: asparagine synthase (glutamine-hydrolyzing) [Stellaceae bacterium]|nr:asparagine synthase (glutamine-hydrolyzing) [Stellaceae bacterium]
MGGIAGLMTRDGAPPAATPLLHMADALRHRGPDGDGHYRLGDVGMVSVRLAVVDLATGDQPLYEPGGAALVADAEICNHLELRRDLPGVAFSTGSDCEPPLHLYRRQGLDFTRGLRGMYAIALHDPASGSLVLARDPFGIKPLYYAETPSGFAFASQPRALFAAGLLSPALVRAARNELVQMQFTTGRATIFAGIDRLLPGEMLVVRRGRIVERRRSEPLGRSGPEPLGEEEALARLDVVLADSVRLHGRADVPCGLLLSGGIDSTALLAMMARLDERPVAALTLGFAEGGDERAAARAAAHGFAAEHVEILFGERDFWRGLGEIAGLFDDPAADYAALPIWRLAAAAREAGLKIVLTGEGGDELFAGYGRYRSVMRPWWAGGRVPRARGVLDGLGVLRGEIAGWRDGIAAAEARNAGGGRTALQAAQAVDCADWLPNDLLLKLDRCLSAFGCEGRTPFLDPAVARLAFALPDGLKVHRGIGKWLLRRWLADRLPAMQPLARRRGPTVPAARWIARRAKQIAPFVAGSPAIAEFCEPAAVASLFAAADQRRAGRAAWTLLFYALWHRRHIEGESMPPDPLLALAETA